MVVDFEEDSEGWEALSQESEARRWSVRLAHPSPQVHPGPGCSGVMEGGWQGLVSASP